MKLSITMNDELVDKAKKYAKRTGRTFSGLLAYSVQKELGVKSK